MKFPEVPGRMAAKGMALLLVGAAVLSLSGCPGMKPSSHDYVNVPSPVTCVDANDCAVKWGRAVQWVRANSQWKFRILTDSYLETFGPETMNDDAGFTVQRLPQSDGTAVIQLDVHCGSWSCPGSLDPGEFQASFLAAVNQDKPRIELHETSPQSAPSVPTPDAAERQTIGNLVTECLNRENMNLDTCMYLHGFRFDGTQWVRKP